VVFVMSILEQLFGRTDGVNEPAAVTTHAVLVHLDGQGLSDHVFRDGDLSTLEDQLLRVVEDCAVGELDGNELDPAKTTLYMYGPDADRLFAAVEPTLRGHPLCRNARVVIRYGAPGASERELRL
jgi:hypothetical protein